MNFRGGNPIVMHFGTNYDFVEKRCYKCCHFASFAQIPE